MWTNKAMHLQPFFTGHRRNPNSDDNSDCIQTNESPSRHVQKQVFKLNENRSCSHPGNQIQLQVLLEVAILIHELPLFCGDFWLNFSTFSTVFSHTHTSRGKPVWVSPTSTSTIWEADAPEVVGAINISWNVSQSTRGVGREKWHIAMNSLWRLHHENKKINHKDINSLTLKWNQQHIIHVRVHMYTHTHWIQKQRLTSPHPLRPT